jgi:hypothetical protein
MPSLVEIDKYKREGGTFASMLPVAEYLLSIVGE